MGQFEPKVYTAQAICTQPSATFVPPPSMALDNCCDDSQKADSVTNQEMPAWGTLSTVSIPFKGVNPDTMRVLTGGALDSDRIKVREGVPLVFDTKHEVSGKPVRPTHKPGFIAWLTRANDKAEDAWLAAYVAWVLAGSPSTTITTRIAIPRATITFEPLP